VINSVRIILFWSLGLSIMAHVRGMEPERQYPERKRPAEQELSLQASKKRRRELNKALLDALTRGETEKARELLDQGADLDYRGLLGTPLHYAAIYTHAAAIRLLLERINALYPKDPALRVALVDAGNRAASGIPSLFCRTPLQAFLDGLGLRLAGFNPHDPEVQEALGAVRALLDNGADPNARDLWRNRALDFAVNFPSTVRAPFIRLLIGYGAHINRANPREIEAVREAIPGNLEQAAALGDSPLFQAALKRIPANPSPAQRDEINRALLYALAQGHGEPFLTALEPFRPSLFQARDIVRAILLRPGLTKRERDDYILAQGIIEKYQKELEETILQRGPHQQAPSFLQALPLELRREALRFLAERSV
jgi:hypothetical protein